MTETVRPEATSAKGRGGLTLEHVFSTEGVHPYDEITWERRDVVQTNWKTGETVFEPVSYTHLTLPTKRIV